MTDSNDIFRKLNYKDKSDYEVVKEYLDHTHPKGRSYIIDPRFYANLVEPKGDTKYVDFTDADSLMTAAGSGDKTLIRNPRHYLAGTIEISEYAISLVAFISAPYRESQALKRFDEFVGKHYTKSYVPFASAHGGGGTYGGSVTLNRPSRDKIPDDEFYTCNTCFSLVISKFVVDHVTYHTTTDKG